MPPYGHPNYGFAAQKEDEGDNEVDREEVGVEQVTLWYMMVLITLLLIWILIFFCLRVLTLRQKTRSSQQRRAYIPPRQRQSVSQAEPTIYVSPANLPPPPKYEAMEPPSYEEVVGIHYPTFQPPVQPITQPITTALAQGSNSADNVTTVNNQCSNTTNNDTPTANNVTPVLNNVTPPAVITVTNERAITASS